MPKAKSNRRNSAGQNAPYSAAAPKLGNTIFSMKTDIGQHVLKNPGVADAIVKRADLKQSDIVLEVGPGTGNLTAKILPHVKKVIAVELDPRMAAETTKRFMGKPEAKRLEVLLGDVVRMDNLPYFDGAPPVDLSSLFTRLTNNLVCISNTPYQISSPLTFKLLSLSPAPRTCILMFQREFASRLTAKPGDRLYSRLGVNAQMWAKVDHIMKVSKANFKPPPAVESSVVRLVPKSPRPSISYSEWDGLLRVAFLRKNKTLRANILRTTSVMDLLEANYRTWAAQNGVELDDSSLTDGERVAVNDPMDVDADVDEEVGEDDEMEWTGFGDEDDNETPAFFKEIENERKAKLGDQKKGKRKKRGGVAELVREKVRRVLEDKTELGEKRSRTCDEGDFLKLLWGFNQEGIHFS